MAELCLEVPHLPDGEAVKAVTGGWVVVTGERIDPAAIRRAVDAAGFAAEL